MSSGNPEDEERAANLDELLNAAHEFDLEYGELGGLDVYLDQASLVSDVDDWENDSDKVTLMTLHAAKGLEFPQVYIVALEDGILPHSRSMETDSEIEEERRLLFVGITRAMQELQISRAMYRSKKGRLWPTIPSTFLMELPRESMEVHEPGRRMAWESNNEFASNDDDFADAEYVEDFETSVYDYSGSDAGDNSDDDVPFDVFVDDEEPSNESDEIEAAQESETGPTEFDSDDSSITEGADSGDAPTQARAERSQREIPSLPKLQTAQQLLSDPGQESSPSDAIKFPASAFQENMLVSHPSYGVGRILSISTAGSKKTAEVDFVSIGTKKFVLAHCPLKPVVE